jgi:RHS repeat-associated protein
MPLRKLNDPAGIGNGWTRHYRYAFEDNAANRTNRLTSTSLPGDPDTGPYSATYDYDAYGNMTRMPHLAIMNWNFMDQLRQVDLGGGGTAHYVYGLGGQRSRKVIERNGNLKLEWIFLGAVMIFRRRRRDTNELRLERWTVHISDNTGRITQVDTKTRDDDNSDPANPLNAALIRYQYSNHLGSAVLETDENGNPISYEEYHPYGTTAYRSAKQGFDLSLKRYRFSGKEWDEETGLYYFGARYYAPWLGRWTSSDPAGLLDGINTFEYCGDNPLRFVDRTGFKKTDENLSIQGQVSAGLSKEKTIRKFNSQYALERGKFVTDIEPYGKPGDWKITAERPLTDEDITGLGGETMTFEDEVITASPPASATSEVPTPPGEGTTPQPASSPPPEDSPDSSKGAGRGSGETSERSFFTSSFFKGLVVGIAVTVAVVAVVATGGAALAAIAPAASAAIASSGVGTVIATAGVTAAGINIVRSVRQEDFWGNRISEEEANYNLGLGIGSFAGGALARPVAGAGSALGQSLGRGVNRACREIAVEWNA